MSGLIRNLATPVCLLVFFSCLFQSGIADLMFDITVAEFFRVQFRSIRWNPHDLNLRMRG